MFHPMVKSADIPMGSSDFVEKVALEQYVAPEKPSLIGLTRTQLADALSSLGVAQAQSKMRVQQLWHWIYFRGVTSFDEMTSVSKHLRVVLGERYTLARQEIVAEQFSVDGTRKWLLRLPGEVQGERPHEVECVYIPDTERGTLCVSSQVGCTLNCTFCHTGTQRLVRNLTAGEIVGQVMAARDRMGDWPGGTRRGAEWRALHHQYRHDGHGRTVIQFRSGTRCASHRGGRRWYRYFQAPHYAFHFRGFAKYRAHGRRNRLHAGGIAACGARRVAK